MRMLEDGGKAGRIMTGMEVWQIVAPMIAPIYALPQTGTPNSEVGMEAYLTVFRALQLLDKVEK